MAAPVFPLATFRLLFPQFAAVSDEAVLAQSEMALCFAGARGCTCSDQMWMLLTAHLLQLAASMAANGGGVAGPVTGSSIGKVSVSFAAPPVGTDWNYWLALTPYGLQFAALYQACNVGSYVGGRGERAGFRVVGGRFQR